jgi:AbrB family looped-hinge helix DNA binding protein
MRLTSKGQVTIPKRVRTRLQLAPGDRVDFTEDETGVRLVKRETPPEGESKGEELVRLLREAGERYASSGLTADEIMEMTRGPFDDVDPR